MQRAYPLLFVFLWSTGFVGAKYGLPDAAPFSFLFTRYLLVILLMGGIALLVRAPWPATWRDRLHIGVSGILLHGIYLGGVFSAIKAGLPAGVTALVVGVQPLITALVAGLLFGERVLARQWLGLWLGLAGVALVVFGRQTGGLELGPGLLPAVLALLGITAGTLYQKRYCPQFDLRTGSVIQFVCAALVTAPLVFWIEGYQVVWTGDFVFALGWLVLVLSIGAISLLNLLIRGGSAVNVASLFYLTPPTTAVIAWLMFDERLSLLALAGMALAVSGVYLVAQRSAR